MAKEINSSIKLSINPTGGGSAAGNATLIEDLVGECIGFKYTIGTTAAAITLPAGITDPKVLMVKNNDVANFVTIDNVIGLTGWPQNIVAGGFILLRPGNATIFGKADTAPVDLWIVAG